MPGTPELPRVLGPGVIGEEAHAAQLAELGSGRLGAGLADAVAHTVVNEAGIEAEPDDPPKPPKSPKPPKPPRDKDGDKDAAPPPADGEG